MEGGCDHHWDYWGLFLPPSVKLTQSRVLDCSVDIFEDFRPPESIEDKTLGSLLALMACIMVATISSSPSVCSRHNEAFHFFNLVLRLVPVVQQSSRQSELISILQYASSLWSILLGPWPGLELGQLLCSWL